MCDRMILMEERDSLSEQRFLCWLEERSADADALLVATHSVERIDSHTIIHQFASEFKVGHTRILHREIEAIGQRLSLIIVIDEIEAIVKEALFEDAGASTILTDLSDKVIATITSGFHPGKPG